MKFSPFTEEMIKKVQEYKRCSRSKAVSWIIDDFLLFELDAPAFGELSPMLRSVVKDVRRDHPEMKL